MLIKLKENVWIESNNILEVAFKLEYNSYEIEHDLVMARYEQRGAFLCEIQMKGGLIQKELDISVAVRYVQVNKEIHTYERDLILTFLDPTFKNQVTTFYGGRGGKPVPDDGLKVDCEKEFEEFKIKIINKLRGECK